MQKTYDNLMMLLSSFRVNRFNLIEGDLCINMNNHQTSTFHPLGDFLNRALALLGQGLRKLPIWQKLNFANHPYQVSFVSSSVQVTIELLITFICNASTIPLMVVFPVTVVE